MSRSSKIGWTRLRLRGAATVVSWPGREQNRGGPALLKVLRLNLETPRSSNRISGSCARKAGYLMPNRPNSKGLNMQGYVFAIMLAFLLSACGENSTGSSSEQQSGEAPTAHTTEHSACSWNGHPAAASGRVRGYFLGDVLPCRLAAAMLRQRH
jgi:hypothetical protein